MDIIRRFNTEQYTQLELFVKAIHKDGGISISCQREEQRIEAGGIGYYRWIKIPVKKNTIYEIEVKDAEISVAYLSGNENILEEGICYLQIDSEVKKLDGDAFREFYNTPYREQYHFVPIKNWINDPNGLCWFQGYYHLYYQANPHSQEWNNMYWGHAASKDMIHWVHLPYTLQPQQEILENSSLKGGAFSGSAVTLENEIRFYLTRHIGPQEDGNDTVQYQTMTSSKDSITFEEEIEIIRNKPEGVTFDFRDPKVSKIRDKWYMVIASGLYKDSAILLYHSKDLRNWEYIGPLVIDKEKDSTTFECPDFYELDGTYVASGALMKFRDKQGRYQMTRYYIGDFKDDKLDIKHIGWYDFGADFYAVQTFEHNGRRIAIGWISDFNMEHIKVQDGAYGSMSIPRELHIKNGRLHMEPVAEVYTLKGRELYKGVGECISLKKITGNSYYVKINFKEDTDFHILLGESNESSIALECTDRVTRIRTKGVNSEGIDFMAEREELKQVEIFVDRRVVEVFLNNGSQVGSKVFYNCNIDGIFRAYFNKVDAVEQAEICLMNSIWRKK